MNRLSVWILSAILIVHVDAFSFSVKSKDVFDMGNVFSFSFPDWMVRENILEQLSWHGLSMKAEFFRINKNANEFIEEIGAFVPEGSILIRHSDSYQLSWLINNVSYVFLIKEHSSSDSTHLEGILSSIVLSKLAPEKTQTTTCLMNWLPDDAQLIFSMGDKVGGVRQARIDGYISNLSHREVQAVVERRLKMHGWVSLAQYPHRSQLGFSTLFEVFCGNRHVRIDLQKQSLQTRISVMSIEQ